MVQPEGRAALRRAGDGRGGTPVVFVPSLINPPSILDLGPDRSLVRWIGAQGFDAYLVDWGEPQPGERDLDVGGHVERLLLPLLGRLERPPVLVGYCLGGTMAVAAAALRPVAGLATIAAPWRFSGYGAEARATMAALWSAARPAAGRLGLVPMEVLQAGFWRLDPERTVAKYEAFGRMDPASPEAAAFVRLEDWANAGSPLTWAAGRDLFERFVGEDAPGCGAWKVGGVAVGPASLPCPAIEFVSLTDRIVPAASAAGLADRRELGAGHVGMVVGSGRGRLWGALAEWLLSFAG